MNTAMPTAKPSRKVVAATGGAGAGAITAGFLDWALGEYVFHGDVPLPVSAFVLLVITSGLAYASGYLTKRAPEELQQAPVPLVEQIRAHAQERRLPPPRPVVVSKDTPHVLGRHVEHDVRSNRFPVARATVVKAKSWRHYGAVLDQGRLGSCTGDAMAQALNTEPLRTKGKVLGEQNAMALYANATQLDEVPGAWPPHDTGSSGLAVAKAAKRAGLISSYSHAFGLEHLVAGLMAGPAIVGTKWTKDMFAPDERGFVHPTGEEVGGHEYLCLGVDPIKKTLTFLNSWGSGWGVGGRFHMTFDDFAELLADEGDALFPVKA